jgi:8-oxo-dGTP pyrophosphatase MutT (NUDIX family)
MDKYTEIRPIVLGIAIKDNKLLVAEGFDNKKNETFYRALGGGIEFGERSCEALKREFMEELGIDIKVGDYLGLSENIFEFNGRKAHELVLMYKVEVNDKDYQDSYTINDDSGEFKALWIDIDEFISDRKILYPKEVFKYLK